MHWWCCPLSLELIALTTVFPRELSTGNFFRKFENSSTELFPVKSLPCQFLTLKYLKKLFFQFHNLCFQKFNFPSFRFFLNKTRQQFSQFSFHHKSLHVLATFRLIKVICRHDILIPLRATRNIRKCFCLTLLIKLDFRSFYPPL